ncbi:hypothetical protein Glove_688g24 [Diversispora epigaea]|uniref:Transposase n=1 Tax=Diversispora epigaea TaxID=1348612 RepID=A0A397G731_9GLOM|nr:hypothetical protein Glove_688g24 [Diversispora epigaea]
MIPPPKRIIYAQEYPVKNSISNDKKKSYSTLNAKDCKPYWNDRAKVLSERLWLPTMIDYAGLPMNSSSTCSYSTLKNSWFSSTIRQPTNVNCPNIYLPSTLPSSADCKEEERPSIEGKGKKRKKILIVRKNKRRKKDENIIRTLNVKLYPNLAQKRLLKRWMGLMRLTYNTIIDYLQSRRFLIVRVDENKNKYKEMINFPKIQFLRTVAYLKLRSKKVYNDIPNNIIDTTVDEAIKNFNSKDNKTRLKFKTKKDLKNTITIHAQNFPKKNWNQFYISYLFCNSMRTPRKKPYNLIEGSRDLRALHFETKRKNNSWPLEKINNDCKLTYYRKTNDWIFQLKGTHERFVAIDPGVRTLFVMYSPTKGIIEVGKNDAQRLFRLCLHADKLSSTRDKLKSSISKRKKKQAKRIDKAISRIFRRIKNLRNELHKKTINHLVKNYDVVIIPEFNVSNMRFVAIDPGVRTLFVMYSPTKGIIEVGKNDAQRLFRLCLHADKLSSTRDKLKSSISKRKKKQAKRIDKAISRIFRRIKNLRNELHKKTINHLVKNYDVVIIPEFNVSNMVRRETRKINSKTVRRMLTWSHYSFRQRLKHKAEEIGMKMIQNEAYTSKPCSACGNIQNIGGRKVYKCKGCNVVMDRDVNRARGIFLHACHMHAYVGIDSMVINDVLQSIRTIVRFIFGLY